MMWKAGFTENPQIGRRADWSPPVFDRGLSVWRSPEKANVEAARRNRVIGGQGVLAPSSHAGTQYCQVGQSRVLIAHRV